MHNFVPTLHLAHPVPTALGDACTEFARFLDACAWGLMEEDPDPMRTIAIWAAQLANPEYEGNLRLMMAALDVPRPNGIDDDEEIFGPKETAVARATIFVSLYDTGAAWLEACRQRWEELTPKAERVAKKAQL